jgi:hypothetical protein
VSPRAPLKVVDDRTVRLTEDEYRTLLARVAHLEDRLDRFAQAFGAACELISESTGLTEAALLERIEHNSTPPNLG